MSAGAISSHLRDPVTGRVRRLVFSPGDTFGSLMVLGPCRPAGRANDYICACSCGAVTVKRASTLQRRAEEDCGVCRPRPVKHGKYGSPTYQSWQGMKTRCGDNPKVTNWSLYGGRGIRVCDRWRESFENFLADMGERPAGTTLDRIDVNGDYEPGNCKWSTTAEQAANRRTVSRAMARAKRALELAEGLPTDEDLVGWLMHEMRAIAEGTF